MTFKVKLESTKKVLAADLVVGVQREAPEGGAVVIQRPVDPNVSHPYRESDIVGRGKRPGLGLTVAGRTLGQYEFRAIGQHYKVTENPKWCWRDTTGAVTRYTPLWLEFLQRLTLEEVDAAISAYRLSRRPRRK